MESINRLPIAKRLNTILTSNNRCPDCKRLYLLKDGQEYCFHCDVIAKEDKQVSEEATKWVENRVVDELLTAFKEKSLMNKDLEEATLTSYFPKNESQKQALIKANEYVDNFDKKQGIIIQGDPGLGKSHLAASIVKEVVKNKHTGIFISLPRLMTELRATYSKASNLKEIDILTGLQKVDLLVLDDLGVEIDGKKDEAAAWARGKVYEVIDSRIGMSTIYTTNFTANELFGMYGERDFSRMMQYASSLKIVGQNYRLKDFL